MGVRTVAVASLIICMGLAAGCATAPGVSTSAAQASSEPRGAVTVVVPFPPGGIDVIARMMQPALSQALGQGIDVVNRPGGAGVAGTTEVARAQPDGRTLLFVPQGPLVYQPQIGKVDYDAERSFIPVCRVTSTPSVLMVAGSTPFKGAGDIVSAARAAPSRIAYSSAGPGSLPHVGMAAFARLAGIDLRHAPAAGAGAAVTALKEGKSEMLAEQLPTAVANAGNGMRIIGVFAGARADALPGVPTLREQGYDIAFHSWNVLMAPAGTPAAEIRRLQEACRTTLAAIAPELKAKMGMEPSYLDSAQTAAFIAQELPLARKLVGLSGLAAGK